MANLNRVFFPLRSNVGWFQTANLREQIADRMKEALLIYDEIIVEDGTFIASITEHGSTAPYLPPGYLDDNERTIEFERDFKPDELIIGIGDEGKIPTNFYNFGMTSARYKIDYFDLFRGVDLRAYGFIKLYVINDLAFPQEAKNLIQRKSFEDNNQFADLHSNTFARQLTINSLNRDLIASILLKSAIVLDPDHRTLLERKSQIPKNDVQFSPVNEQVVVRRLLSIAAPNFSDISIEEVLELRDDALWQDFRGYVGEVLDVISSDPEIMVDENAIDDLVRTKIERDLFTARKEKHMTGRKLGIDLTLGLTSLIPGYGLIPTVGGIEKATAEYLKDRSGWFAFLLKLEDG